MNATLADLAAVLERAAAFNPFGFKVHACAPGECTLRVPFDPSLERPGGIVSGITVMGGADVAMWLAVMTLRGVEETWVTADMKTAFLRSGRQEDLFCTAKVLKLGKRTAYGTVETHGATSGLLAHHVLTYARVDP